MTVKPQGIDMQVGMGFPGHKVRGGLFFVRSCQSTSWPASSLFLPVVTKYLLSVFSFRHSSKYLVYFRVYKCISV